MESITIQDVGPIFEHTLPIEPGVTVLMGGNEAGKSTSIACVAALAGRDVPLAIRDGAKQGMIRGLGTTLIVGAKKKTRSGEFDAEAVEEKIDLAGLVEPGLKDAAAATRKRIRALLSLTGQALTIADFKTILPEGRADQELLAGDTDDDPVEMAGKIKRRMEAKAREWEAKAKDLETQLLAKAQQYMGLDVTGEHDGDKLQQKLIDAVSESEKLKAEADAAKADAEARASAGAWIHNEKELVDRVERVRGQMESAAETVAATDRRLADIAAQIEKLKDEEKQLTDHRLGHQKRFDEAAESLKQAEEDAARLRLAREQLSKPTIAPPSDDDLAAAAEAVDQARKSIENAAIIRRAIEAKAEHTALMAKYKKAVDEGLIFRSAADSTDAVLSNAVACETLKVVEGELIYVEGNRKEPFARLSAGRRYQVAICEIAKAVAAGKKRIALLPLSQEAWDGLEHATRDKIHKAAVEHGIAIVTGQIRDAGGPLTSTLYKANGQ